MINVRATFSLLQCLIFYINFDYSSYLIYLKNIKNKYLFKIYYIISYIIVKIKNNSNFFNKTSG
jgi:hypothetical protein